MEEILKVAESVEKIPTSSSIVDYAIARAEELQRKDVLGNIHSNDEILKEYATIKALEKLTKELVKRVQPLALNALLEEGAKKTTEKFGVKFTLKDNEPEYDFSDSEEWREKNLAVEQAEEALKKAKAARSAQEELLKAEEKAVVMWSNQQTLTISLAK